MRILLAFLLCLLSSSAFGQGARQFVKELNSIADLRKAIVPDIHRSVNVKGYFQLNDGGDGTFLWDQFSILVDDGGMVIEPTNHLGRWIRQYDEKIFPVEWWGGTNVTSATIQKAIDFASAHGGGYPILRGTYVWTGTITNRDNVTVTFDTGGSLVVDSDPGVGYVMFRNNSCTNCGIYGGTFDAWPGSAGRCIEALSCTNATIEKVQCKNFLGDAIYVGDASTNKNVNLQAYWMGERTLNNANAHLLSNWFIKSAGSLIELAKIDVSRVNESVLVYNPSDATQDGWFKYDPASVAPIDSQHVKPINFDGRFVKIANLGTGGGGGGIAGTLIGPLTPTYIPYASTSTNLADSSLLQFDAATIFHMNAGVPQLMITGNGGLMIGRNTSNFWGGLPISGETLVSIRDEVLEGLTDVIPIHVELRNSATTNKSFIEFGLGNSYVNAEWTSDLPNGSLNRVGIGVATNQTEFFIQTTDGIGASSVRTLMWPDAPDDGILTPYYFDSSFYRTNLSQLLFAVKNFRTNQFTVAVNSGYDGSGTHFLSDDGTYYPKGGTNTFGGINPTDNYIPYRVNSTAFGDSPWYRVDTNAVSLGSTTNILFSSSGDVVYSNATASGSSIGIASPGSSRLARYGNNGGGDARVEVDAGRAIFLTPNGGSGSVTIAGSSLTTTVDSAMDLGQAASNNAWRDTFATGAKWIGRKVTATNYTTQAHDFYIAATATLTNILPGASSGSSTAKRMIIVKDVNGNTITVRPSGTNTIEGAASDDTITGKASVTYISDGISNWEKN